MSRESIFVTKPYLPPLEEFLPYLKNIWDSGILSNCGSMHEQLEQSLCEYLGVPYISLFDNGTNALLLALKVSDLQGEVITTPLSFVATSHAILWNQLTPVFVDVDEKTLNIDPDKIESAITKNTSAIMPVHCYGNSCDVEAIQNIADQYGLKVIYDAAHAFGVDDSAGSILCHGDLSTISFHATKVFNTFEGGAIVSSDASVKKRIDQLRNFGFVDELSVTELGLNGKMSEINSAFGLLQLKHIDQAIDMRREVVLQYKKNLAGVDGIQIVENEISLKNNYSYFPILVKSGFPLTRDELFLKLKSLDIHAKRYFFPLISGFDLYKEYPSASSENLPVAVKLASEVLCLPVFPALKAELVVKICSVITEEC